MSTSLIGPVTGVVGTEGAVATATGRNITPFVATVLGYDTVNLSWTSPQALASTGFYITRSRSGYPRTFADGVKVAQVETPTWNETTQSTVSGLRGGWHYFSFFLKQGGEWMRVATVDALIPYDYASTDKLWDTIPAHYKFILNDTAAPSLSNLRINPGIYDGEQSPPNLLLSAFLSLFGWGFDFLRTQAEGVLSGYDVDTMHVSRLALLSQQFGNELEYTVPAHSNRTLVRNLATLYRKRGTLAGIKDLVTMASGWEVDVSLGPNLMLSEEQANFVYPEYPDWDSTKQYIAGNRVVHGNYLFQALSTSRGMAQAPPSTATSNTWWDYQAHPRMDSSVNRLDTGDVSTWQILRDGTTPVPGLTKVGAGSQDPEATSDYTSNALQVFTTTAAASLDVVSIPKQNLSGPLVTPTPANFPLENAIVVPNTLTWVSGTVYNAGDQVKYKGALYLARTETATVPTDTLKWDRIGHDDRPRLILSAFAHGPFSGTAGSGGKATVPIIEEYDKSGSLIRKVRAYTATFANSVFDPFVDDSVSFVSGRTAAMGGVWSADAGSWTVDRNDTGGWASVPATGKSHRWTGVGMANTRVAVTFTADPGTTRLVGLVLRRSDDLNYWIATQTGLFKVVAGAARANPASGALSWTKFLPGERMMVNLSGNDISVYRNGTLLGTATDAFNATATAHGLGTEA